MRCQFDVADLNPVFGKLQGSKSNADTVNPIWPMHVLYMHRDIVFPVLIDKIAQHIHELTSSIHQRRVFDGFLDLPYLVGPQLFVQRNLDIQHELAVILASLTRYVHHACFGDGIVDLKVGRVAVRVKKLCNINTGLNVRIHVSGAEGAKQKG